MNRAATGRYVDLKDALHPPQEAIWGEPDRRSDQLIVFVHGYAVRPENYMGLLRTLREKSSDKPDKSDLYACRYDAGPYSTRSPDQVVNEVFEQLNRVVAGYKSVHLVGHSLGCLVLRDAILESLDRENITINAATAGTGNQTDKAGHQDTATGTDVAAAEQATATTEQAAAGTKQIAPAANALADHVRAGQLRITLLAGTNRGFTPAKWYHKLMVEMIHRWMWLLLLTTVWGLWCRKYAVNLLEWRADSWLQPVLSWECVYRLAQFSPVLIGVAVSLCGIYWFIKEGIFRWRIGLLLLALPVWASWGIWCGSLDACDQTTNWVYACNAMIVAYMVLTAALVSKKLGYHKEAATFHTLSALVVGSIAVLPRSIYEWVSQRLDFFPFSHIWSSGFVGLGDIEWLWISTMLLLFPCILHPFPTGLLIEETLHGSSWITAIRLRWLKAFAPSSKLPRPQVVHLFGSADELVNEEDHAELDHNHLLQVEIPNAKHGYFQMTPRKNFWGSPRKSDKAKYTEVARAVAAAASPGWKEKLKKLNRVRPETYQSSVRGDQRNLFLNRTLELLAPEQLKEERLAAEHRSKIQPEFRIPDGTEKQANSKTPEDTTADAAEAVPQQTDHPAIVFLIHGIRDYGEWQESLSTRIQSVAEKEKITLKEVVSVRYGYFSALQFLFSGERERATRAFLDLYAQTRARNPTAKVHVVAHSNGSYVVGTALKKNAYVEVDNLYLAGSVLSQDFRWSKLRSDEQNQPVGNKLKRKHGCVKRVHSDRAAWDWPVGVLCWMLSWIGKLPLVSSQSSIADIGSGGVDGFREFREGKVDFFSERFYLPGDHGEALRPHNHENIAKFILKSETLPSIGDESPPLGGIIFWRMVIGGFWVGAVAALFLLYIGAIMIAPTAAQCAPVLIATLMTLLVVRTVMAA